MEAVLIGAAGVAGAVTGHLVFPLAGRDPRTVLPERWRAPMAVLTGLLCALMAWRFGAGALLPAALYFAVFAVLLGAIDVRTKLLPNALVLPFFGGAAVLLVLACVFDGGWPAAWHALLGGAAMFGLYLILALISPAGMGMGDVKLSAVLGLYAGYLGLGAWLVSVAGAFIVGAVAGVALLVLGRTRLKATLPFGPSMLLASGAALTLWRPILVGVLDILAR